MKIVGIDIDGVLNKHREHFANLIANLRDIRIDPNQITKIPVRHCSHLGVKIDDEHAVFNHPSYWQKMPVADGAREYVGLIKGDLDLRIWLFTSRPWPNPSTFPPDLKHEYQRMWRKVSWTAWLGLSPIFRALESKTGAAFGSYRISRIPIESLTTRWLQEVEIPYDQLTVEWGEKDGGDLGSSRRDRFSISEQRKIAAFVEDNLENAKRLSAVCQRVFLMDQPYNQVHPAEIPNNIARVESWQEVYEALRLR